METPDLIRLSQAERNRRIAILRLAASLGAEAITLGGSSAAAELLEYARTRNVTRLLIGVPNRSRWRRLLRRCRAPWLLGLRRRLWRRSLLLRRRFRLGPKLPAALLNRGAQRSTSLQLAPSRIDHVVLVRRELHQSRRDHDHHLGVLSLRVGSGAGDGNLTDPWLAVHRRCHLRRGVPRHHRSLVNPHPHGLMDLLVVHHRYVIDALARQAAQRVLELQ